MLLAFSKSECLNFTKHLNTIFSCLSKLYKKYSFYIKYTIILKCFINTLPIRKNTDVVFTYRKNNSKNEDTNKSNYITLHL